MAAARPSTPVKGTPPPFPATGRWRHPQIDEIVKRQNASTFGKDNLVRIAYNAGGVLVTQMLGRSLWTTFPGYFYPGKALHPYANWTWYILNLLFMVNIIMACYPLFRKADDLSDIALTPAQRKLLGLPPSPAPPTPGSQYSTPPRYARTPSGSPASKKANFSNSPLAGKGSPRSPSAEVGSPFSPNASPLLQKSIAGMNGTNRRHSYGSPSPLGPGGSRFGASEAPGSPSPGAAKGAGIGLNSKWLYDKERRSSGTKLYT